MIRAILIDDEARALVALEQVLRQIDHEEAIEVIGKFQSVSEAIRQTAGKDVNLIFLDIEMPGIRGLAAVDPLLEAHPAAEIIFVTAYQEYAVEAFELNAMDYLLKPVSGKRLRKSIDRYIARHRNRETDGASDAEKEPAADERLRLNVMGGLELYDKRGRPVSWRTKLAKELFAYLWHHRSSPALRNRMLDKLWPNTPLDRALAHFHTTVYQVRALLKQLGCKETIAFADERYWIRADDFVCDELRLLEMLERDSYTPEVLGLYGGDYLEVDHYEWAETRQRELRAQTLAYLEKWAECAEGVSAEPIWRKLIAMEPYAESYYVGLMRLYGESGNAAAAGDVYRQLQTVFRSELGLHPSAAAQRLAERYGI